ncbi:DUF6998 domain-containing protein [Agromyces atrinae]|uniref:DUF6998 domain-containing protein n=1 Tax=Agromyces atrinae TaxID=592376 RepID=A0A852RYX5_9MICO|nr:hypothetical protein [Agromyces atrinae]NYD66348.1 hypothetical protein [Agromyces atrinae]
MTRADSDEHYVLDLCDEVLGSAGSRQHRFDWLLGDPGAHGRRVRLPVDSFWPTHGIVVEYRERQHDEPIAFFDKPERLTLSGVHRGIQRRMYDERRDHVIPEHGLRLFVIRASDLDSKPSGRLRRSRDADLLAIESLLAGARTNEPQPHPLGGPDGVRELSVGQLLRMHADILRELRRRGLVRTKNAPLGDLAEYAAALAYGGVLAKNSKKSFDLIARDGRRIQVKARSVDRSTSPSQTFSIIRTLDFDAALFVLIDSETNAVSAAYEWLPADIELRGRWSNHTRGRTIRINQLGAAGTDVTALVSSGWLQLLSVIDSLDGVVLPDPGATHADGPEPTQ